MKLERRFWQAMKDGDVETCVNLTDDPCIVTGPQGIGQIDRNALAAMLRAATHTLDSFELEDEAEVRMLGDDVAIVAYQVHEQITVDGETVSVDAADSSTWVRRGDTWLCAMHSEALAGDPFGRDRLFGAAAPHV
jgi:ketosteroid isomerase-like protein